VQHNHRKISLKWHSVMPNHRAPVGIQNYNIKSIANNTLDVHTQIYSLCEKTDKNLCQ